MSYFFEEWNLPVVGRFYLYFFIRKIFVMIYILKLKLKV